MTPDLGIIAAIGGGPVPATTTNGTTIATGTGPEPFPYEVRVQALHYGYRVEVGCKVFAVEKVETLIAKLTEFFNDPHGTANKFFNNQLFT